MYRVQVRIEYVSGVILDCLHIMANCADDARKTAADEAMNKHGMSDKDPLIELSIIDVRKCA